VLLKPRPKHTHVSGSLSREAMWQLLGKRIFKKPLRGKGPGAIESEVVTHSKEEGFSRKDEASM